MSFLVEEVDCQSESEEDNEGFERFRDYDAIPVHLPTICMLRVGVSLSPLEMIRGDSSAPALCFAVK